MKDILLITIINLYCWKWQLLEESMMEWDNENNDNMEDKESLMKKFIESKGFKILPKYLPCFEY